MENKGNFFLNLDVNTKERIFGLDLMRFIAISMVVLAHGDILLRKNFPGYINYWVVDGVDVFFVLSGFLIGTILIKSFEKNGTGNKPLFQFWKNRWFRTLPNYFLILTVCLIYFYIQTNTFGDFSIKYLFFLQNFATKHPNFFAVAWSLAVEEWFYILFPITIIVLTKIFRKIAFQRIILIAIAIFLILPLLYRIKRGLYFNEGEHTIFYIANPTKPIWEYIWDFSIRKIVITRLDTIVFGVIGAYITYYYNESWKRFKYLKFIIGCFIIYIVQVKIKSGILYYTVYFDLIALGLLFLLPLFSGLKSAGKYIATPVTYISVISYSIYLIHYSLILDLITTYCNPQSSKLHSVFFYFLYLGVTIILSIILYKFFEKPVLKLRERKYVFFNKSIREA